MIDQISKMELEPPSQGGHKNQQWNKRHQASKGIRATKPAREQEPPSQQGNKSHQASKGMRATKPARE